MTGIAENQGANLPVLADDTKDRHIMIDGPFQREAGTERGHVGFLVLAAVHGKVGPAGFPGNRDRFKLRKRRINRLEDVRFELGRVVLHPQSLGFVHRVHGDQIIANDRPAVGVRTCQDDLAMNETMVSLDGVADSL